MRDTVVVIVPAALGYLALAVPIVSLLLQHGRADANDAENIARTLQAFAVGLPFFSAFQLLTRTFYAMQDTRTPALVNVAAAVVNIAANLLYLSFDWGVPGLALGHATSYAFATRRVPGGAPEAAGPDRRSPDRLHAGARDPGGAAGRGRGVPGVARRSATRSAAAPARSAAWSRSPWGLWWACLCSRCRRLS